MPETVSRQALLALGLVMAASAASTPEPRFRYEHRLTDQPWSIHILEVDPDHADLVAVRARDAGRGRERVSSLATRKGAVAAINGGFFRIGGDWDGDPAGALRIDSRWFSDARRARGAIGWRAGGREVLIDRLRVAFRIRAGSWERSVDGLNRSRAAAETVVYAAGFGSETPPSPGRQLVTAGGAVLRLAGGGPVDIPDTGWVAAMPDNGAPLPEAGEAVELIADVSPADGTSADDWERMDAIVGGTPVLIRDGRLIPDFSSEEVAADFVDGRHPRTAVCIRGDGHWLLVAVDGRQPKLSVGMTMRELAGLLLDLGCRDALNLDGGGSTTLFWKGRIVNSPSDPTGERPVSDAILVLEARR